MRRAEIIERLEKLTGPDREVDAEIVAALHNATVRRYPPTDDFGPRNRWQFWSLDGAHFLGSEGKFPVPHLTASLDAAVALVEKMGYQWLRRSTSSMSVHKPLTEEQEARKEWGRHFEAAGPTPAIALVLALFRSLPDTEER